MPLHLFVCMNKKVEDEIMVFFFEQLGLVVLSNLIGVIGEFGLFMPSI